MKIPKQVRTSEADARRFAKALNKKLGTRYTFEEWGDKLDSLTPFDASELVEDMERTSGSWLKRFFGG